MRGRGTSDEFFDHTGKAGVQRFGGTAVLPRCHQSAGKTASDAHGICCLIDVKAQTLCDGVDRAKDSEHTGWMKSILVKLPGSYQSELAREFISDGNRRN